MTSRARMAVAASVTALVAMAGVLLYAISRSDDGGARQGTGGLTTAEYQIATDVARHEAGRLASTVRSATATVEPDMVTSSNTGHDCTSSEVVHVRIIGDFPHVATGGPNGRVTAEDILADTDSGEMCLISVRVGEVAPEPGAVDLPIG